MVIEQFEDKGLAHFSYILMSEGEIAIIDPARDPSPYYEFANLHDARIIAVIETHPHADFVSSHQEIGLTKEAEVYTSKLTGATYQHNTFDDGDFFQVGDVTLHAINTPGHSPDSICILVRDEKGIAKALFSGDTLFIGDVGRPDLRENAGTIKADRESLARDMYRSTREKLIPLPDDILVYPSHGAGSLCGKGISGANSSTMGAEKANNPALQPMTEDQFVDYLLSDQPFVPQYFAYDVELNKTGAPAFKESLLRVPQLQPNSELDKTSFLLDTRPAALYKAGHLPNALNLQDGLKFETWLGSVIAPEEKFYLIAADAESLETIIAKTAKIGYEQNITGTLINPASMTETTENINLGLFKSNPDQFTIIDIRNKNEVAEKKIFPNSIAIPLPEIRLRKKDIPTNKPIVVHCAGGYRSALGSSMIAQIIPTQHVYDLGEAITQFN